MKVDGPSSIMPEPGPRKGLGPVLKYNIFLA